MITITAGFFAGLLHVLSGPDHLAAVAPMSAGAARNSWKTGLRWGVGHTAGVLLIGALSLVLRGLIPVDAVSAWSERLVGVMLIVIGAWALRKALQIHSHQHLHGGVAHEHLHAHRPRESHSTVHMHRHAAFGIGTLHGLAGSSHFLGIVPALALPSTEAAIFYLGAFGIGTICAMTAFSGVIGNLGQRFSVSNAGVYRAFMSTCSVAAIGIGVFWLSGNTF